MCMCALLQLRWIGLLKCAVVTSKKTNRAMLKRYAGVLREKGFGPRPFDPRRYRRRRRRRAAEEAGGDDRDGESSDNESGGSDAHHEREDRERVQVEMDNQVDDGYAPIDNATIAAGAAAAPSQQECVRHDDFDVGNEAARGRKRKNLLNRDVGLTDLNFGRSAYLAGLLKPYKVLVEQLQNVQTPEQHLAARRLRTFYMVMKSGWIGTATSEPMYAGKEFHEWVGEMEALGKRELVAAVKKEARAFASIFVVSVKRRLSSTWNYLQCLELIDPLGPCHLTYAKPEVWAALRDLYERRDIQAKTGKCFAECRDEILSMRASAPALDPMSKALIRSDLCAYLRERREGFILTNDESPTPAYDALCTAFFSIPLSSSFVESLFSKMVYNQSKIRSSLKDQTMSDILHMHDVVLADPQKCLSGVLKLKVVVPTSIRDKLTMNKNVGVKVCDVFDGERHHGEVTEVIYHDVHAQYMYRVVFSDNDCCDYWRHELELVKCRCESNSDSDA